MARPSRRLERRRQICEAFERCLARDGLGGATVAAVATEAGVAPGLIHHHFDDRSDLVRELVRELARKFRNELPDEDDPQLFLDLYVTAALGRRGARRRQTARAWVGIFAEAVRRSDVRELVRRALDAELTRLASIARRAGLSSSEAEQLAAGVIATIAGALLFGAIMPTRAQGFAAPWLASAIRARLDER
ncbi:MAG: TetR/AcrR family transcriptional regulator [Polyangiaceae bacterium]